MAEIAKIYTNPPCHNLTPLHANGYPTQPLDLDDFGTTNKSSRVWDT